MKDKIAEIILEYYSKDLWEKGANGRWAKGYCIDATDKILSLIRESLPAEDKHDSELLMAGSLYEAEKVGYNRYRSKLLELLGGE